MIDRALVLWSNPGDRVWTPFMGVGSEVYAAVAAGRYGIGAELKPSYYAQAVANLAALGSTDRAEATLFDEHDVAHAGVDYIDDVLDEEGVDGG